MGLKFNPLQFVGFDLTGNGGGGSGTVYTISLSPMSIGTITNPTTDPIITINNSSTTQDGYLSAANFTIFNNKQNALTPGSISTTTSGLNIVNGANSTVGPNVTLNILTASATQNGLLSSTDWSTFNSKQGSGNYLTALTGDVSATGPGSATATVNSVGGVTAANIASGANTANAGTSANTPSTLVLRDSSGNFSAGVITATLIGGSSLDLPLTGGTMSGVIAMGSNKITGLANGSNPQDAVAFGQLANYVPTSEVGAANGVASLDPSGKVPSSQLPSTLLEYQGDWNPNTNTPTLSDGTGTNGYTYRVSAADAGTVPGLTDPSMTNFQVGNLVIYSASAGKWQQNASADGVVSVNGAQGAVTVNAINQLTGDIAAGPASGSQSVTSTIQSIQGKTVGGTTGTGNVVFSSSPTLTGTLTGAMANFSGNISALNFSGSSSGSNTGDQTITLTGDVTGSGTGSFATSISPASVTLAKMANLPANTIIGNNTASSATPIALTQAQVTAFLNQFTTSLQGVVPPSGGGTTNYLRADGTWAAPSGATSGTVTSVAFEDSTGLFTITGSPVTSSGTLTLSSLNSQAANTFFAAPNGSAGSPTFRAIVSSDVPTLNQNTTGNAATATFATSAGSATTATSVTGTNVITNSNLAQIPAHTYLGNNTGSTANVIDVTNTQLTADLNQFTSSLQGVVPGSGGGTANFLRADGTWATPTGTVGANTSLSNLTTTSINQNLLPLVDDTFNLGSTSDAWQILYAYNLTGPSTNTTINLQSSIIQDSSLAVSVDWGNRQLDDTSSTPQLTWSTTGIAINKALALNGSTSGAFTQQASATTTPYTVIWPSAQSSGVKVLQNDGAGNLSWATPASSGANTALSNLASVAINTSLLPASAGSASVGSVSLPFNQMVSQSFFVPNIADTAFIGALSNDGSDNLNLQSLNSFLLYTQNNSTANSTSTGGIEIVTGNKLAGTGNSGNLLLRTGVSTGGTRGLIQLQNGSEGTAGYVWTSTDTSGSGSWQAPGGTSSVTSLTGDVTGTGPGATATTVAFVGGQTAAAVASATTKVAAATNLDTPSTLVLRDSSGNFSASTITASLVGNVTGDASQDLPLNGSRAMTGGLQLAQLASAPSSPVNGETYYDTTLGYARVYEGGAWISLLYNNNTTPVAIVGQIIQVGFGAVPPGCLECNGSAVSRTTYNQLFAAIGTSYGIGDGSTTFNLPDFRGLFIRGWNHGSTNDPDAATRTEATALTTFSFTGNTDGITGNITGISSSDFANLAVGMSISADTGSAIVAGSVITALSGGNTATLNNPTVLAVTGDVFTTTAGATGDYIGSYQADQNQSHTHGSNKSQSGPNGTFSNPAYLGSSITGNFYGALDIYNEGGNQANPRNTNAMFVIVYDSQLALPVSTGISGITGDVTSPATAGVATTTVVHVGGQSAAAVASAAVAVSTATSSNTPSTLVERDSSGNFSAGTITASLTGHASLDLTIAASSSTTSGSAGSTVIGDNNSYYNFTPTSATVKGALSGIDAALSGVTGSAITSLTGNVVATGPGAAFATIQPNVVTNSMLSNMANDTIKGNISGSTGSPQDLTVAQVNSILPVFTSSLNGLTPASGGGTTKFLRADGTWTTPTGSVTSVALADSTGLFNITGSPVTGAGTLTLASLQSQTANTFFAAPNGLAGAPTFRAILPADVPTLNQNTTGTASNVSGIVAVTNGGTGDSTLTANAVLIGNGTSPVTSVSPGSVGNVLVSNGTSWTSNSLSSSSAFSGYTSNPITTLGSVTTNTYQTFSNSPAFTITPTISGVYKVYCNVVGQCDTPGQIAYYRIYNTSANATLLTQSGNWVGTTSTNIYANISLQNTYQLTAGTTYVFDLQAYASTAANAYLRGDQQEFYMYAEGIGLIAPAGAGTPVSFSTYLNTAVTAPANGPVIYDTVLFDTNSGYNTSTGLYTIPYTGDWQFNFSGSSNGTNINTYLQINGTNNYLIGETGSKSSSGSIIIPLIAGNTVAIVPDTTEVFYGASGTTIVNMFSGVKLNLSASSSGITRSVNSISTATTAGSASSTDYVYLVSGTTTLTLPTAVGNTNLYTIKNVGTNTISIATTSSQTIDGSSSPITLSVANTSIDLISNGSNWNIV